MDAAKVESLTVVGSRAGMGEDEIGDCLLAMETSEVKDELRAVTDQALSEGAYGLPYIITRQYQKEDAYFGSDRFELMANRLNVEWLGPVPDEDNLEEIKMAPYPDQVELHEHLESVNAVKFDAGDDLKAIFEGVELKNSFDDEKPKSSGK